MSILSLLHSYFALSRIERVRHELDFYSNNQKGREDSKLRRSAVIIFDFYEKIFSLSCLGF
jgi:hypothetical protein